MLGVGISNRDSLIEIPTARVRFPYPAWTGHDGFLYFYKISSAPSEDSDQSAHPHLLISPRCPSEDALDI